MARKSLRSHMNQIRTWVRQGRTDAWIAHQLEVSASQLREFKRQQNLEGGEEEGPSTDELDLRDEIEAEVEAVTAREAERGEDQDEELEESKPEDEDREGRPRRRRRRGGRGRRRAKPAGLEATFDHGETDGYGLWLDPAVKDNPTYAEHWTGQRKIRVTVEQDRIVIERAGDQPAAERGRGRRESTRGADEDGGGKENGRGDEDERARGDDEDEGARGEEADTGRGNEENGGDGDEGPEAAED